MVEVCRERESLTTMEPSGEGTKKGTRARTRPVEEGDIVGNAWREGNGGKKEGGEGG